MPSMSAENKFVATHLDHNTPCNQLKTVSTYNSFYSLAEYAAETTETAPVGNEARVRNGHSFEPRKSSPKRYITCRARGRFPREYDLAVD